MKILKSLACAAALCWPASTFAADPYSDMVQKMLDGLDPDSRAEVLDALAILSEEVLDWCERQGGEFMLPNVASPGCVVGNNNGWVGYFGLVNREDRWWWNKRTEFENPYGDKIGILWLTISPNMDDCAAARAALNNPARIPVELIGPHAPDCRQ